MLQLWDLKLFHVKLHNILHETSLYLQILDHFGQSYECLFPENCKKPIKNLPFGAIPDSSLQILSKKHPFFGALKFKHLWDGLAKFKKQTHPEILSLSSLK